jgi:hypothetical protein
LRLALIASESKTDGGRTETTTSPLDAAVGCVLDVVNVLPERAQSRMRATVIFLRRCGPASFPLPLRRRALHLALAGVR